VKSIATPFVIENIPDISPTIFHIGSLTRGDIPLDILKFLAKKSIISLDVQGFLREIVQGSVKIEDWDEKIEALPNVDIVKADEMEAKILTGEQDMEKAAKRLSAFGPKEVIITLSSNGSLIYYKEKFYYIPSYPPERIIDPTGCGDTYMAGYIYKRLRSIDPALDFNEIGKFSAAIASLKLEGYGPFKGSADDVEYFLETRDEFESFNNCCWKRE
jgi:sugar/nucleoside kinase (ribokinase family)